MLTALSVCEGDTVSVDCTQSTVLPNKCTKNSTEDSRYKGQVYKGTRVTRDQKCASAGAERRVAQAQAGVQEAQV